MSYAYAAYLQLHRNDVLTGYHWLQEHLPDTAALVDYNKLWDHDNSKRSKEEFEAYDAYFYGGNRSFRVVNDFNRAWLHHIHANPHHWQHWVLFEDDPSSGTPYKALEMPQDDALEMVLDWWSFSWAKGNLLDIFSWYDSHKDIIKLHPKTRSFVEATLQQIREKLEEDSHAQP